MSNQGNNLKLKGKQKPKRKSKITEKGALVKGYLEKKDRKGFEFLLNDYREVLGSSSGIYALWKGKNLYYTGIAQNLLNRIKAHTRDKHKNKWDKLSIFIIDKHKFSKDIETVILRIAEPRGNGTRGKFEKHYELQDKLNKVRTKMRKIIRLI
jgi:hypothetical protein